MGYFEHIARSTCLYVSPSPCNVTQNDNSQADSRDGGESDIESVESDIQQRKKGRSRGRSRGGSHNLLVPVTTKSARAHAKSYRPGPPLVPQMIVKRLLDYVTKIAIRKRQPFIERLCRYWSLKREARRGAPLLKRLHLEVRKHEEALP